MEEKILYTAVVLDDKSHGILVNELSYIIPDDWKVFAHHMTIVFGEGLPKDLEKYNGMKVRLNAIEVGISDMAIAVKVEGFHSNNEIPHITVAVNVNQGGKPFMSNQITNWKPLRNYINKSYIDLTGKVEEIKQ